MRFTVGGPADPASCFEEQAEARFGAGSADVHGVHMAKVGRVDQDTDFLFGFPGGGLEDGFACVEFAGGQVPESVERGVGVPSLSEQDVAVVDQKHVHVDQMAVGHRRRLRVGCRDLWDACELGDPSGNRGCDLGGRGVGGVDDE